MNNTPGLAGRMQPPGAPGSQSDAGADDSGFWSWLHSIYQQHQQNGAPPANQTGAAGASGADTGAAAANAAAAKKPDDDLGGVEATPIS